jgi:gliding motility-associated-like protein
MQEMKRCCLLVLLAVLSFKISFAQQGKNGAGIITANTTVNEYTSLTINATGGSTSITVSNNSINTHGRFSSALSAGDLIMIIQMQGATINSTQDTTWGAVTNYGNCGLNEFAQVQSVSGTTIINLQCPLQNNYTATGNVQVVRIPRYTTLTINAGDTLICDAWNGVTGGIIAVEVQDNTIINGAINATEQGFRGGALMNLPSGPDSSTIFASTNTGSAYGAQKGEGIAGYENDYTAYGGMYGRGAPANGGGGGNVWNSAGGGGANAGNISVWTGNGNPDITTSASYATAWNLEYPGFANSTSSGGGRAGYATAAYQENPYIYGPNNSIWSSLFMRENVGGKGGRPLNYSTGRLFMGGGGGAGHEDDNNDLGGGGNGGGLIYIVSYGTVSGNGSILSNGQNGYEDNSTGSGPGGTDGDGPGGAGGGGTIIINSAGTISGISIYANGGVGGIQDILSTYESQGPGGGGGGGYIATTNTIIASVLGGANGTTNSLGMAPSGVTPFLPNGATKGGDGTDTVFSACLPQISSISGPLNVCSGASNIYSVSGGCSNTTYVWSLPSGWSGTSTTNSITATAGTTGGKIQISASNGNGSCPLDTFITVTVYPAPVSPNFPKDTTQCGAINLTLNAGSTGFNYLWSTGVTTTSIAVTTAGIYWLQVSSGCDTIRDSINVIQKQEPTVFIGNDTLYCDSFSRVLDAGNTGASYLWSTGSTSQSITVTKAGNYSVTVSNTCGTAQGSITITSQSIPKVYLGKDTSVCDFKNYILKSDTIAATYLWSTGATSESINVPAAGTYWVTVSNACGRASDTIIISGCVGGYILPNAFTPGGNNANSLLGLLKTGSGNTTLNYFRIYNRWGQLIFSTNDDQSKWDGRYNGQPETIGVYVYVVSYLDTNGASKLLKGNITLLR